MSVNFSTMLHEARHLIRHFIRRDIAAEDIYKTALGKHQIGKGRVVDQILFLVRILGAVIGLKGL